MRNGKVCFGLAGLGMGGETHARQLLEIDDAVLLAAYGRNEEKAKAFADKFGVPRIYTDFEEMLEDREVDVVNILTPNGLHRDFAIKAANAGKHVVVEKPLEINLARAQEIIAACRNNDVRLGVIFQMRFGHAAQRLKQAIEAGKLGRILIVDVLDKEYRPPEYYSRDYWRGTRELEGGGCLLTQSIHVIDLMQWLAGPVRAVFAKTRTALHDIEVEDTATAVITYESGAVGVFQSSTAAYPAFKARVEVHGTGGSAIINGEWDEIYFWNLKDEKETIDAPSGFKFTDESDPRLMPETRHRIELQDIIDAIKDGREPQVTGNEGLKSLAIAEAIYESSRTSKEVAISEVASRAGVSFEP